MKLRAKAAKITFKMKLAAAKALAAEVRKPKAAEILPQALNKKVAKKIAEAVADAA